MDFVYCWILISSLNTNTNAMPSNIQERLHICANIISYTPEGHNPAHALAIGWLESRFSDIKGRWLCTRKGKLSKNKAGHYKCTSNKASRRVSKLVRAEGPMQILKLYHCKGEPNCNTTKRGVQLLYRLIGIYGEKKGIAIYAGGTVNPKSKRYANAAIALQRKLRGAFPSKHDMPMPKDISLFWHTVR